MSSNPEKPTLWLPGLDRRDRLFLWWLSYRLPPPYEIDAARLGAACERCAFPMERALVIMNDYEPAWRRMMEKRAARLSGQRYSDPDTTPGRVSNALMTDLRCRHPRMLKRMRQHGVLR